MRLLVALLAGCLLGCQPTIDGSSPQASEASLAEIKQQLSLEDRTRLDEAVRAIVARELGSSMRGGFGSASDAHDVDLRIAEILDGKTVSEVIAYAENLRAERQNVAARP